jgi:hypothetical protein
MKLTKYLCKNKENYMSNIINSDERDIFGSYNELSYGKLFIKIFKSLYSLYEITDIHIDEEKFIEGLNKLYNLSDRHIIKLEFINNKNEKKKITEGIIYKSFIIIKNGLAVWITYDSIFIIYNNNICRTEVLDLAVFTKQFEKPFEKKKEFHMVVRDDNSFSLLDYELKEHAIDIKNNYNDDFTNIHEVITLNLNEKKKNGIILLHGTYGAGKTYYIRYLISNISRKFIYLPLHMVDWLSDPAFIPFMSKFKDCVLILEDCENLLMHRDDGNPNAGGLSNLLNLGDGLLSDAFSINIICSFNSNLKKIDDALLRKGRLIARYEFKELEIPKAQALADKLEKNIIIEKPMTLTDIYNAECMKFENKKANKIGFAYV